MRKLKCMRWEETAITPASCITIGLSQPVASPSRTIGPAQPEKVFFAKRTQFQSMFTAFFEKTKPNSKPMFDPLKANSNPILPPKRPQSSLGRSAAP
jgi:hypothetical protein